MTGSECGDVASVLALATALAIDPRAELAPQHELDPVDTPPPASSPAAPQDPREDRSAGPSARSELAGRAITPQPSREGGDGGWFSRGSLGVSAAFAIAPRPSIGPAALLALRRERAALLEEIGLGFVFRTGAPELVRGAKADFYFYAARPTLCTRGIGTPASLYAAPCLSFEAGGVTGVGSDLPVSSRHTRFWAAAEVLARLEHPLPAGLFITLEGGAFLPLTRYRFVFQNPETPVHDVPALTVEAALRVGTRL